jgi:hypothetical protein
MPVDRLLPENKPINIGDLAPEAYRPVYPVYVYSCDLFIENTSKTNITNFELKVEFFCSEEDFPNDPKKLFCKPLIGCEEGSTSLPNGSLAPF